MALRKLRLDSPGIGEVLRSAPVAGEIRGLAEQVKRNLEADPAVQRHNVPVTATPGTTDRARVVVALTHPAGMPIQAKHGSVTRAAAAAGLEVTER